MNIELFRTDNTSTLGTKKMFSLGLQHVLVMYAGTITVPLILATVLQLDFLSTILLINAALFTSGLATLLQSIGVGPFGARLPLIQGCSFIVLAPLILIGKAYDLQTIFGSVIACGLFTILFAPIFSRIIKFFPPIVVGCIITIIGISLIPAAAIWLGGGNPKAADFTSPNYLILGFITLITTILLQIRLRGIWKNFSILFGMMIGTLIAIPMGLVNFNDVNQASWIGLSSPFSFGFPKFEFIPITILCLSMIIVMTETTGNILLINKIKNEDTSPTILANTIRADGLSTIVGGALNSFPYNAFSQNAGLLMLTKVLHRGVLVAAGIILCLLGIFPKLGAIISTIPKPVLGGVGILMFGMTLAAGIQILKEIDLNKDKNILIVATSISIGTLPIALPSLFDHINPTLKMFLDSGIFLGGATAVILNIVLNKID